MSGVYYGLAMVAVYLVIRWMMANDSTPPGMPTKGLLAMKLTKEIRPRRKKRERFSLKNAK